MNEALSFEMNMIIIIIIIVIDVIIYIVVYLWLCHCCFEDQHKTFAHNGIRNIGQCFTATTTTTINRFVYSNGSKFAPGQTDMETKPFSLPFCAILLYSKWIRGDTISRFKTLRLRTIPIFLLGALLSLICYFFFVMIVLHSNTMLIQNIAHIFQYGYYSSLMNRSYKNDFDLYSSITEHGT